MSLILASVLNVATPAPTPSVADLAYPVISAHRGGLALYPENTLAAFKEVRGNHPDQPIEFDVRGLKDGTPVIIHDATVDRTATATGKVADMTPAQWSALRIKDPAGGTVPASTLDQVIAEFGGTDTVLVPELKDSTIINQFIQKMWPYRHQVIAQAFNPDDVSRLVRSGFRTLQLTSTPTTLVDGVYALGIKHTVITPKVVDDAHRQGATVWAWTVNDQTRIDELMNMEVDAVITNDPRLTVEATP